MKKTVLILAAAVATSATLPAEEAVAADAGIVAETLRADGTTNTWTAAELQEALGLMNRMYWRDMESENGRERWHGRRLAHAQVTNAQGRVCVAHVYADGLVYTNAAVRAWDLRRSPDPEAAAKAAAERAAKEAAARRAWEIANLPAELAALRAAQREAEATTNEVAVVVVAGEGD